MAGQGVTHAGFVGLYLFTVRVFGGRGRGPPEAYLGRIRPPAAA